jgi:adenine-specific DNA-methyltransferase
VDEFNAVTGRPGYFTETFCIRSRFVHPRNGERIDAIREAIAGKGLGPELEAVMLVSLMEAADRVDSTTGVQMAYLKGWAPRSSRALELRVPEVLPRAAAGKGRAVCLDAAEAAGAIEADVAYIDPPYNQHSYLGNYHVWESLVRWDKPEVFGVACKRVDVKDRRSDFNSRRRFAGALRGVLEAVRAPVLVVSFSNEGYVERAALEAMLGSLWGGRGRFTTIVNDFKRYVGAQIGIHNGRGEKVGRVSHLRNEEYVYIVTRGEGPGAEAGVRKAAALAGA